MPGLSGDFVASWVGEARSGPPQEAPGSRRLAASAPLACGPPLVQLSLHFYKQIAEAGPEGFLEVGSAL